MSSPLSDLDTRFLRCRGGYNHAWDDCAPPPDASTARKPGTWQVWLRCTRCKAVRLDQVNRRTGALEGRRYWLPYGYSDPDLKGIMRDAYRRELVQRRTMGE